MNSDSSFAGGPDLLEVRSFLQWLRPGGPWVLTAILPDGGTSTTTLGTMDAALSFVSQHNGIRNIYYTANEVLGAPRAKPTKKEIASAAFIHADLDPNDDEDPADAKARYFSALAAFQFQPSAVVDSGNGLQVLWRLDPPAAPRSFPEVEAASKAAMERLGAKAGTQNVDRLLRLPGTVNLPNNAKRRRGRHPCPSRLLRLSDSRILLSAILGEFCGTHQPSSPAAIDWSKVKTENGWLQSPEDLPPSFSLKGRIIVGWRDDLEGLNQALIGNRLLKKPYSSWSEVTLALAAILKREGHPLERIAEALLGPLPCNKHVHEQSDKKRAVERAIGRSYDPPRAKTIEWHETTRSGAPKKTMPNARLAIKALEISCRFDEFHNRTIIDHPNCEAFHSLEPLVGELGDDAVICIRQLIAEQFGVDFEARATKDAIQLLALHNRFDPVKDMLSEAEGSWDGTPRLDAMAVTYLNCDDTPFARAAIRKMMIAAVRRVRQPGCKFDSIVVLESEEGFNKSTAFRVLAGEDNFSDQSILQGNPREIQEQLAGIWIHENAELAGMSKTDVEKVKAFASRQIDIARRAYAYFPQKSPRRSIEVGTTNSDTYLQSQTGNRRFWPLRVNQPIDIEKLKEDRLQLWGEAASCESTGESLVLDQHLWPAATEEQERRRTRDPWEEVLNEIPHEVEDRSWGNDDEPGQIQIVHVSKGFELVSTKDLLTHVLKIPLDRQNRGHTMRLAEIMKRLGWGKNDGKKIIVNGVQIRGYVRERQPSPHGESPRSAHREFFDIPF